ncbi:CRISPR-associated endonuclease Cas3'' [Nocardiopsis mangrovi]|uniref:CRISPR-associated endonuclease Cas3 n=1 Tax=Nocardiopsis mangrovi TaxID=1179818 RepID=A0ABV9DW16_9ACTN
MTTDALFPSPAARTIWGKTGKYSKTYTATDWHPLLAHMLDTMHIADRLWEHYLARSLRERFSAGLTGGTGAGESAGRAAFRWLAALHDIGKATPGFQSFSTHRFPDVLRLLPLSVHHEPQRHELMSAHLVRIFLEKKSWPPESIDWVANVVGGHHGVFPPPGFATTRRSASQLGGGNWREVQGELFTHATRLSGVDLSLLSANTPDIGAQMAISGAVIVADWLASDETLFPYGNSWPSDYPADSARISARFRSTMHLGDVWRPAPPADARTLYAQRFEINEPRSTQVLAHDLAVEAPTPGLMIVEAPTGEGKTEAALAAAEVLAARFGFNGLFFALPTQATANSVFDRVLGRWLKTQHPRPTVGLAHGKARRHPGYGKLLSGIGETQDDAYAASTWMRGAKLALLAPVVVGTIDQLLFAGVSARHVMLRHIGLANKVVVIDEIHAYDAYMSAILCKVLHWLGRHGVPVLLLSATLPEAQRHELLGAYTGAAKVEVQGSGYPRITWAPVPDDEQREAFGEPADADEAALPLQACSRPATTARGGNLTVEFAPEPADAATHVADLVSELISGGTDPADPTRASDATGHGCVLVLRNTVKRAQAAFDALSARFPGEVTLTHARFTAADRARLDADLTRRFGPPERAPGGEIVAENPHRPRRHIVVATQVAEQSLDVDFDVLVTDLAPVDLLLQRAGRCHRHDRPGPRPAGLEGPRMIITGYRTGAPGAPPAFPNGDGYPYRHHLLLRTLADLQDRPRASAPEGVTRRAVGVGVPADVPALIASVYGTSDLGPDTWRAAMAAAEASSRRDDEKLRVLAGSVLIATPEPGRFGLDQVQQHGGDHDADDEEQVARRLPVRPGAPSVEVLLLRRTGDSTAETVSLPAEGEMPLAVPLNRTPTDDEKDAILGQAIRLSADRVDTATLASPRGWRRAPWCSGLKVLFLNPKSDDAQQKGRTYRYSPYTGWQETT